MAGRAEGKLQLKNAKVFLQSEKGGIELKGAVVYIHLKGFAFARVTHLDIEHDILDNIIPPKRGYFLSIHGIGNGIEIKLEKEKKIKFKNKTLAIRRIGVIHPYLEEVLGENEKTRTWVGGKFSGIYIGFKKEQIVELEMVSTKKLKI